VLFRSVKYALVFAVSTKKLLL